MKNSNFFSENLKMQRVAKFLNKDRFIVWLLIRHPDSNYLQYVKIDELARGVSKAQDLKKNFKQLSFVKQLDESLYDKIYMDRFNRIYDDRRENFVVLSHIFYSSTPHFHIGLPEELQEDVEYEISLIYGNLFTEDEYKELQIIKAITNLFEIDDHFILEKRK
jgi:hypothetical protein